MSLDSFIDLNDFADSITSADVRIISGAYVATADQFVADLYYTMRAMLFTGMQKTLDERLPEVAKKTGAMRQAIFSMFTVQIIDFMGIKKIRIRFDRSLLNDPEWLKYHDIDWELNPKFNIAGYKAPTTPGTRPFSETEIMSELYANLVNQIMIEWTKKGFSYTIRSRSR
ncbi:hypothetical protein LCGC14_0547660 [marine sediment metagenome]|uniref:Uncharacterized protein n=1 Tax=marine sediment metagenome TaxID=412755 RepID=A0A0F9RVN5_9ZZZZ